MHPSVLRTVDSILSASFTVAVLAARRAESDAIAAARNVLHNVGAPDYAARAAAALASLATASPATSAAVAEYLEAERDVAAAMERRAARLQDRADRAFRDGLPTRPRDGKSARSVVRAIAASPALEYVTRADVAALADDDASEDAADLS